MNVDPETLRTRYEPETHPVPELAGLALSAATAGGTVEVLTRAFFSSYDDDHRHYFSQILSQLPGLHDPTLNQALVVIRENTAYVYKLFPLSMNALAKTPVRPGRAVFQNQIVEVTEVRFRDSVFEPDIRNGDKLVWLFRIGWSFGLYFDFSGEMRTADLWETLGQCYKSIDSHSLYSFLSHSGNPERLIERGWFPFIQLSPEEFRQLKHGIETPSEMDVIEKSIVGAFTADRIDEIASHWWADPAFSKKREIISAGLRAYSDGNDDQTINCIKNLFSEVEGILRLHYDRELGTRPTTANLKDYLKARAVQAFPHAASLAFSQSLLRVPQRLRLPVVRPPGRYRPAFPPLGRAWRRRPREIHQDARAPTDPKPGPDLLLHEERTRPGTARVNASPATTPGHGDAATRHHCAPPGTLAQVVRLPTITSCDFARLIPT